MTSLSDVNYACKCLNVRIRLVGTSISPPDLTREDNFKLVFVGEEGITVEHTEVTVRTRKGGKYVVGDTYRSRYTTITCLLCDLHVYRVHQALPADIDDKDGPMLPTEDWVEREILKSINGWIEVSNDCLFGEAVHRALTSSNFVPAFSLLLPESLSLPMSIGPIFERPPTQPESAVPSSHALESYFSTLRPVFLPPPFTPSLPVFTHFASLATKESQFLRSAAADYLSEQWRSKVSEIEKADAHLRIIVETLWKKFMDGVSLVQQLDQESSKAEERVNHSAKASSSLTPIRDFIPTPVPPAMASPQIVPRISALSASLTTSTFHHPQTSSPQASSIPGELKTPSSNDTVSNSLSLVLDQRLHSSEGSNVLKYRRNLEETVDYATSYKYLVELEKEMALLRGRRLGTAQTAQTMELQTRKISPHAIPLEADQTPIKEPLELRRGVDPSKKHYGEERPHSQGREKAGSKSNRKVTFDVQPSVVTIQTDNVDQKEDAQESKELIFDLEEIEEEGRQVTLSFSRPALQSAEQPTPTVRPRWRRQSWSASLPNSYSGLRPASLPPPSNIHPPRSPHGLDSSRSSIRHSLSKMDHEECKLASSWTYNPLSRESRSLFPVNISPDRRVDNKARKTYVRRQAQTCRMDANIPEERENDADSLEVSAPDSMAVKDGAKNGDQAIFVGSLPIPILSRNPTSILSLASYEPDLSGNSGAVADRSFHTSAMGEKLSSAAIRRALYTERDLLRCKDPGPMDFVTTDEEGEYEGAGDTAQGETKEEDVGSRGRKQALRILQSQNEIPEAGMWRSLAS